MGNLGVYEEFTTLAKGMGGVDSYLESIAAAAVSEATPKLVAKSAGATAVVGVLVAAAIVGGKALWAKHRAIKAAGQDAESHLRAMAEEVSDEGESLPDEGHVDSTEPGEPTQPVDGPT